MKLIANDTMCYGIAVVVFYRVPSKNDTFPLFSCVACLKSYILENLLPEILLTAATRCLMCPVADQKQDLGAVLYNA